MIRPNRSLLVSSHILSGSKFKDDNPDLDFLVNPKQSDYFDNKVKHFNSERLKGATINTT
jgi:hypothetical protein